MSEWCLSPFQSSYGRKNFERVTGTSTRGQKWPTIRHWMRINQYDKGSQENSPECIERQGHSKYNLTIVYRFLLTGRERR